MSKVSTAAAVVPADHGELPRWDVADLPAPPPFTFRNMLKVIGPGAIMAATSIGGGEWLVGPAAAVKYSTAIFLIATIAIVLQVIFNLEAIQGAPASMELRTFMGGFFGGRRVSFSPTVRLRTGDALTGEVAYQRNDVTLPWGAFVTNLVRARLSYAFTTRAFVQGLVQYNDRADLWSANVRVGWLRAGNTGLFVVYTDTRALDNLFERPARTDRSFIVKFSRTFDVLH